MQNRLLYITFVFLFLQSSCDKETAPDCFKQNGEETTITHHCTASIGIALFDASERSPLDALKRADGAMYQAKTAGRNQLRFDRPSEQGLQSPDGDSARADHPFPQGNDPCSNE